MGIGCSVQEVLYTLRGIGRMQGTAESKARDGAPKADDDSGQSPKEYHTPHESYPSISHRPCCGNDVRRWSGPDCRTTSTGTCCCTAAAPVAPLQAVPAKIAVIEYEQATAATNEGQRALQELQKKYEPQKTQLQRLAERDRIADQAAAERAGDDD